MSVGEFASLFSCEAFLDTIVNNTGRTTTVESCTNLWEVTLVNGGHLHQNYLTFTRVASSSPSHKTHTGHFFFEEEIAIYVFYGLPCFSFLPDLWSFCNLWMFSFPFERKWKQYNQFGQHGKMLLLKQRSAKLYCLLSASCFAFRFWDWRIRRKSCYALLWAEPNLSSIYCTCYLQVF